MDLQIGYKCRMRVIFFMFFGFLGRSMLLFEMLVPMYTAFFTYHHVLSLFSCIYLSIHLNRGSLSIFLCTVHLFSSPHVCICACML